MVLSAGEVRSRLAALVRNKTAKQAVSLYGSSLFVLVAGLLVGVLNTRALGPEGYGLFTFSFTVVEYVVLVLDLGVNASAARLLAANTEPAKRDSLLGGLIVVSLALTAVTSLIVFAVGFVVDSVFKTHVGWLLRVFCPLYGLLRIGLLVESVCRGLNRIAPLSFYRVGTKGLHLAILGLAVLLSVYSLPLAVAASLVVHAVVGGAVLAYLRPSFRGLGSAVKDIATDVKVYGFKVYTGSVAATASYRTDSLLISYLLGTTDVGYYRLAGLVTQPMGAFSGALATSIFAGLAGRPSVPRRFLVVNIAWLTTCTLGLWLLGGKFILLLFGPEYAPACKLVLPFALAAFCSGLAQPYHMFLSAKGQGTFIRSTSIIFTIANLAFNLTLIPAFGLMGAAYASFLAHLVNCTCFSIYYRKAVRLCAAEGVDRPALPPGPDLPDGE